MSALTTQLRWVCRCCHCNSSVWAFHLYSLEPGYCLQSAMEWRVMLLSLLGRTIYLTCLEFWVRDLSIFLHLFLYSIMYWYLHKLMNIYIMLWVILWHYFILLLKLSQFWPLGVNLFGSCVPLAYTHNYVVSFCFLTFFSLSGTTSCSRLILSISCLSPGISHFSKHPWFLLLENGIRNQLPHSSVLYCVVWALGIFIVAEVSLLLGPLNWQRKAMYLCKHISLKYFYM